jgi:hypothetical protein
MSNKTSSEISADILTALIEKISSTGNLATDAQRAAEAYKVIFAAVRNPG